MSGKRAVASLALVCAILGCESSGPLIGSVTADFAEMSDLWSAQGVEDYYLELSLSNEWFPPWTVAVEVRNGDVTRVRGVAGQTPSEFASADWHSPDAWERGFAMDSLYSRIAEEIADPEAIVETRFDTRLGLLSYAYVDRLGWADDSYRHSVRRFVRQ